MYDKFYLPEHGEGPEDARKFTVRISDRILDFVDAKAKSPHPEDFAEMAADYYHSHMDGWESDWPVVFAVLGEGLPEHRVSVGMEMMPIFKGTSCEEKST